ncbi:MAG: polysaccharide deacetylase family protein [Deltaproteobacteria bacterium]|nr:polysaccharide deacetylase family protein [Deltaproteobacteria bacterium]
MKRRFALSIDLDPLSCYRNIYALPQGLQTERENDPVYTKAIPRFCELCDSLGIKGTLFIVGESLDQPNSVQSASQAAEAGHELANHTHNHHYDLSKTAKEEQITLCSDAIEKACGIRPVGFRAPGYLLGSSLLPLLPAEGFRYDSSVLPSPAYQGLKASVLTLMRLLGRPSASILGDPREALVPSVPYRPHPHRPWRRGMSSLVELPISAPLGLPLTGGLLALGGRPLSKVLAARLASAEWVQLELHGVDLLDLVSDGLDPALGAERSLRIDWRKKMGLYRAFIEKVIEGREVPRLCDVKL